MIRRKRALMFLAPFALVAFIIIAGEAVLHLWNWLLPTLFGWRAISFWQAIGLLALCRILFGGLGARGMHRPNFRRRMTERWENMSAEERTKFRAGMRGRCGPRGVPAAEAQM